jgi:hypothetical protein
MFQGLIPRQNERKTRVQSLVEQISAGLPLSFCPNNPALDAKNWLIPQKSIFLAIFGTKALISISAQKISHQGCRGGHRQDPLSKSSSLLRCLSALTRVRAAATLFPPASR